VTRIEQVGDGALLVTLGDDLDLAVNARARRLATRLAVPGPLLQGVGVPVPGHASVLVTFDPELADEAAVRGAIHAALDAIDDEPEGARDIGRLHELRVAYGGIDGPDLADVAAATGLTEHEVVRLHAGVEHRVLVLGFLPGFAYLGGLPVALELPRRPVPRVRVPAGSVAIAGLQTGIYPSATPGGWHLVGRTEAWLWDPAASPPARLAPGDRVRFVPA
jgi:KipI family sensor histidine kinase inhibitor